MTTEDIVALVSKLPMPDDYQYGALKVLKIRLTLGAVLLFFSGGPWDEGKSALWRAWTNDRRLVRCRAGSLCAAGREPGMSEHAIILGTASAFLLGEEAP